MTYGWLALRRFSVVLGLAMLFATASSARAATLYVDAAAASAPPGTGCGAAAAYTVICGAPGPGIGTACIAGSAVAAASPGDTIVVCEGTYAERIEINKSNLTLNGAKAGVPAGPSATPAGRGAGETVLNATTTSVIHLAVGGLTGVIIDGFTIQSGNFAAIHDNTNNNSNSHVWRNNILVGSASCTPALINLNRFNNGQILNSRFVGCQWGISVQSGNLADQPSLIEENYFLNQSASAGGIIMAANNGLGHTISGNRLEGTGSGMILGCGDLTLTDNVFDGRAGTALFLHSKATGATISGNDMLNGSNGVRQSTAFGPYTPGVTNEVHYNNIVGSTSFGVENGVAPGVQDIDATCNWWGSADGPAPGGSGSQVSSGVAFLPWLTAPAPNGDCVGGLTTTSTSTSSSTSTSTSTSTTSTTLACNNVVGSYADRKRVLVGRLTSPAGAQQAKVKGRCMPFLETPTIDPIANGIRVILEDSAGNDVFDALIPGGAYDPVNKVGWKVHGFPTGFTASYKNGGATPLIEGIKTVKFVWKSGLGITKYTVVGKTGDYVFDTANLPLSFTLVVDGAAGQCCEALFLPVANPPNTSTTGSCAVKGAGSKVLCRGK